MKRVMLEQQSRPEGKQTWIYIETEDEPVEKSPRQVENKSKPPRRWRRGRRACETSPEHHQHISGTQPNTTRPGQAIPGRIEPDPLVLLYGIGRHPIKRHSPAIKTLARSGKSGPVQHFAVFFAIRELLKCR
ncbi:uncharacterized protein LOC108150739 [Drosophila elegans]|uniref:uncharacterized protein LOC108150739 n=1 Tax=Drosophila elegans TaxID=30023 RepID=UPI0007E6AECC|nr:uncharacterized protein LOC108150739 [Drosophila elegans]